MPPPAPRAAAAAALLLAALAAPLIAASGAGGPEPVSDGSTADNAQRKAAWAPDGTLYVTFVQPVDGVPQVFMKWTHDGGQTWTMMPRLSTNESFRPAVAVDSKGVVTAAWSEYVGNVRQVFTARWDGGPDWVGREQVSFTPGYSGFPSVGIDGSDGAHLVWYGFDGQTYRVHYRYRPAGGDWGRTTIISGGVADANSPAIAVSPDGLAHVAFFASVQGGSQVWYLHGGPGGWDDPERVSGAGELATHPSIAVFRSGEPTVAYVVAAAGVPEVVVSTRGSGGAWGPAEQVSLDPEGGDFPSIAAGDLGQAAVFYETPGAQVRFARLSGSAWGEPSPVDALPPAHWPSVTWSMFPNSTAGSPLFVVWTEGAPGGVYRLGWERFSGLSTSPLGGPGTPGHPFPRGPALVAAGITAALLACAAYAFGPRRFAREPPR